MEPLFDSLSPTTTILYKSYSMRALLPLFSSSIFHNMWHETIENVIKIFSIVLTCNFTSERWISTSYVDHQTLLQPNCSSLTNFSSNRHHHLDASIDFQSINQKYIFFSPFVSRISYKMSVASAEFIKSLIIFNKSLWSPHDQPI